MTRRHTGNTQDYRTYYSLPKCVRRKRHDSTFQGSMFGFGRLWRMQEWSESKKPSISAGPESMHLRFVLLHQKDESAPNSHQTVSQSSSRSPTDWDVQEVRNQLLGLFSIPPQSYCLQCEIFGTQVAQKCSGRAAIPKHETATFNHKETLPVKETMIRWSYFERWFDNNDICHTLPSLESATKDIHY